MIFTHRENVNMLKNWKKLKARKQNGKNGRVDQPAVFSYYDDSPVNSEFQRLVNKLDTFRNGTGKQVILVTSAMKGEGKSTISSQLAIATARNLSVPTLLVDTDLRHSSVHKLFGVTPNIGLADCLEGRLPLEWCVQTWGRNEGGALPNLRLLTGGDLRSNPLELITLEKMKGFLQELRSQFDVVILDSAPIIPVSDPLILGRLVDTVILVIRVGETSKQMVKRAIEMMNNANVEIHGLVLNNVDNVLPYYYNHQYYHYQYYTRRDTEEFS